MVPSMIAIMNAAAGTLIVVYIKAPQGAQKGLHATGSLTLVITPRMIATFTLAGLIQTIVPQKPVAR